MFSDSVIITDKCKLAARLSACLYEKGKYLPVFNEPRLNRHNSSFEKQRLMGAIDRVGPNRIILGEVSQKVASFIENSFSAEVIHVNGQADIDEFFKMNCINKEQSVCSAETFYKMCSEVSNPKSLVIAEEDDFSSTVIAANYALFHGSAFRVIPRPSEHTQNAITELLNEPFRGSAANNGSSRLINGLRAKISPLITEDVAKYDKVLFVTAGIPYGMAVSTKALHIHPLFLGQNIVRNMFGFHRLKRRRTAPVMLFIAIDDDSIEYDEELLHVKSWMRAHDGYLQEMINKNPFVVREALEAFPADVTYISTHSGPVSGYEVLYEYTYGKKVYEVVVREVRFETEVYTEIVTINNEKMGSEKWKSRKYGRVWADFAQKSSGNKKKKKQSAVQIERRAINIAAGDATFLGLHSVNAGCYPLVILNSCGSWVDIFERLTFSTTGNFIGTLWPISNEEARQFCEGFFSNFQETCLLDAFWLARESCCSLETQNAYVLTGTFESRFDSEVTNPTPGITVAASRLRKCLKYYKSNRDDEEQSGPVSPGFVENATKIRIFYLEKTLEEIIGKIADKEPDN